MSRTGRGAAAKTGNEKYVRRGADLVMGYNPGREDDVRRANGGKVGAPYRHSDALVMMAAALRSAPGARYGQPEGMVGRMAERRGEEGEPGILEGPDRLRPRADRGGARFRRPGACSASA